MIIEKEGHAHKYTKKLKKVVMLSEGKKTAQDTILMRQCKCGETQAYDLKRKEF